MNETSSAFDINPARLALNPGARIRRETGLSSLSHFLKSWTPSSRDTINFLSSVDMHGADVARGLALWLGWNVDPMALEYANRVKKRRNRQ